MNWKGYGRKGRHLKYHPSIFVEELKRTQNVCQCRRLSGQDLKMGLTEYGVSNRSRATRASFINLVLP
jgi:hypothetical protein